MKFEVTHEFDTDLATFEQALFHPRLFEVVRRSMQGIKEVQPLEMKEEGRLVRRRVKYVPTTEIPSFARGKIKPEMLEWIEESTYDRDQHRFDYRILPNIPERWNDRFRSSGSYTVTQAGNKVRRVIDGEVVIKVTLVGGIAERYVIGQVKNNFDQEAEGLRLFLRELKG